jgi:hypothetical protein
MLSQQLAEPYIMTAIVSVFMMLLLRDVAMKHKRSAIFVYFHRRGPSAPYPFATRAFFELFAMKL